MKKTSKIWWWLGGVTGSLFLLGLFNRERVMSTLKNIKLSENFSLSEFVVTATGIENIPGPMEVENIRALVQNILQPLRNAVARRYQTTDVAVIITSGYRSPLVNSAIGGSSTSQHKTAEASDFHVKVNGRILTNQEVIDVIKMERLPYDQLIDEQLKGKKWVHVSYSKNGGRRQLMTARDGAGGKTVYTTISKG